MPDLLESIRTIFPQKRVLVVGDLVADQFLSGTISRVSREAPVFIMRHEETVTLPGGGANAAANAAALGGKTRAVGVVGNDENGGRLLEALKSCGVDISGVVGSDRASTTTKVRVLAGQHLGARNQVIRIDYEGAPEALDELSDQLNAQITEAIDEADVVIVSDYNYGVASPQRFQEILRRANERDVPVVVDSRFRLDRFAGATSATPNREEVEHILGPEFTNDDCERLRARLGLKALLVTNGNQGMSLYEEGREPAVLPAIGSLSAVDVTGAGDTVIAVFALGLASGLSYRDAASVANHAGGIVVMKKRTAVITPAELMDSIGRQANAVSRSPAN